MKRTIAFGLLLSCAAIVISAACTRHEPAGFPHVKHLTGLACGEPGQPECLTCKSCHGGIQESDTKAVNRALCSTCHATTPAYPPPMTREPLGRAIIFSHEQHLKLPQVRGQCVTCHGGLVGEKGMAVPFPPMSTCLECHQEQFDRANCTPCHRQGDLSRLLPQSFMRHDADWQRRHGMRATHAKEFCNQCHSESECNDCHDISQQLTIEQRRPEQFESTFIHRADFVTRHAMDARNQPTTCLRCHSPATCDACHIERGVSAARLDAPNPHPIGWVGPNTTSPDFHGRAARRDLISCVACHDQGPATNCIRCHKVGGFGGNPHPRGWSSTRSPNSQMCRFCHAG
jgi:hypothetical protein